MWIALEHASEVGNGVEGPARVPIEIGQSVMRPDVPRLQGEQAPPNLGLLLESTELGGEVRQPHQQLRVGRVGPAQPLIMLYRPGEIAAPLHQPGDADVDLDVVGLDRQRLLQVHELGVGVAEALVALGKEHPEPAPCIRFSQAGEDRDGLAWLVTRQQGPRLLRPRPGVRWNGCVLMVGHETGRGRTRAEV